MQRLRPDCCLLLAAVVAAVSGGCSNSASYNPAMISEHRSRLLLSSEPAGAATVLDVREALLGTAAEPAEHDHEHAGHDHDGHDQEHDHDQADHDAQPGGQMELPTPAQEVVVVGQIGGLANPWAETQPTFPFVKQQAKFFLADPGAVAEAEASGHVHAPGEECAFCAVHAQDNSELLAVVQFADSQGNTVPIDAQTLFEVTAGATVVVRGQARVVPGGILVVAATGLYVRE